MQTSTVKVVVNERTLWVAWEAMRAERAAAVSTRAEGPTTACSRAARVAGLCPGVAETSTSLTRPCRPVSCWATAMSATITEAFGDPGMATPWTTPTRVKSRSGWLDTTRTCCPIRRCAAAKVPESTTTCSGGCRSVAEDDAPRAEGGHRRRGHDDRVRRTEEPAADQQLAVAGDQRLGPGHAGDGGNVGHHRVRKRPEPHARRRPGPGAAAPTTGTRSWPARCRPARTTRP